MKFLFIVQGEGRGHLTQAITLEEMLLRNGHEVVEVLVGESSSRILPGFFNRNIQAPVKRFISPNFLPAADNKRANLKKSFIYNLLRIPEYFRSMCYINQRIKDTGAEVVINFYELLTGLTYTLFRPSVPYVCVGADGSAGTGSGACVRARSQAGQAVTISNMGILCELERSGGWEMSFDCGHGSMHAYGC